MKPTFNKLPVEKRDRIVNSSIKEFGHHGYDHCSLDRIILDAGISKGGLYEYIQSKEDLFLFLARYAYGSLYNFIENSIEKLHLELPDDIIDRTTLVASIAIEFYLDNPDIINFITKCQSINDEKMSRKVYQVFRKRFEKVFGNAETSNLAFDIKIISDLLIWLLAKTRQDFVMQLKSGKSKEKVRASYTEEWHVILSIFRNGIYKKSSEPKRKLVKKKN
jgi:AcrR family transcriptional regulator